MASIKSEFKTFLKNNYLNLNYNDIYKKLKHILRHSENKDKDLKEYVYLVTENIVSQNISKKNRILTSKELARRDRVLPAYIHASMTAIGFFQRMCEDIDSSHKIKEDFGMDKADFSSVLNKELDKTVIYETTLKFIKKDPFDSLLEDVNNAINFVQEDVPYSKLQDPKNKDRLQDIYMKKEMAKDRMNKHGKIWKFFYSSLVDCYNEFIEKSENLLRKYEFDNLAIADAVKNYARVNDQFDDKGHLKDFFEGKQKEIDLKNKSGGVYNENTVNLIRYNNAKKNESETHELENKMRAVTSKYKDMDPTCSSIGLLKEKCKEYDNTKDPTGFKETARLMFWDFYSSIVSSQGAENLNIKEAMHDANKLTLLVMNKYTPIYEDPALANILPELSFGTMNADSIERLTKKRLENIEINVKEVAQNVIDEYKQLDNVKQDKQFLGVYREEALVDNNDIIEQGEIVDAIEEVKLDEKKLVA